LSTEVSLRRLDGTVVAALPHAWGGVRNEWEALRPIVAASGKNIYIGDQRDGSIQVFDETGKLVRVGRTADTVEAITPNESANLSARMGGIGSVARTDVPPKPTKWPALEDMKVDPSGRIWVEDYRREWGGPTTWTLFNPDGTMVGRMTLPADN